jgi:hypothetical protein
MHLLCPPAAHKRGLLQQFCKMGGPKEHMAKQLDLKGRRFWIMSEPHGAGWKAFVVEMAADQRQEAIGIEATAETRTAADDAAERKLRRMLQAY